MVTLVSDVAPGRLLDFSAIDDAAGDLDSALSEISPVAADIAKASRFLAELRHLMAALQSGHIDVVEECILMAKLLFRGTNGTGINFFMAYKPEAA